jgi:hypothetical protein
VKWRWPWTSCARLDDAKATIDRLQASNTKMLDDLTRLTRREAGLPEEPRPPRPLKVEEPMPRELQDYIRGFASLGMQRMMRDAAVKRHTAGQDWKAVVADVMREEPTP